MPCTIGPSRLKQGTHGKRTCQGSDMVAVNCQVAQQGQAGQVSHLQDPVATQIQAQQCTEMTQAVHVSDAVTLYSHTEGLFRV